MFFDFGAGELIGLVLLAMILLGPDKLPQFAVDAAKMVKKIRNFAATATNELKENLGPGFEDLQPSDLQRIHWRRRGADCAGPGRDGVYAV